MRDASQHFLKAVLADMMHDPEIAACFPGASVKDDSLQPTERGVGSDLGWICRWHYEHGVHWVPAPSGMQVGSVPAFDGDGPGIVFDIFVACKQGDDLVSRIKNYPVLKEPRLAAAFDLQSGAEPPNLQKRLDAIIAAHLPEFRRAVGAL